VHYPLSYEGVSMCIAWLTTLCSNRAACQMAGLRRRWGRFVALS
jgi:hypothetical protein